MPSQHAPKLRSLATVLCGVAAISMCITTANASVSAPDTGKPYDVHADARRVERLARRVVAEARIPGLAMAVVRSEEHTSELQSLMRISYAVFLLKTNNKTHT